MITSFLSIIPLFLVIFTGFLLSRFRFVDSSLIKANNKLVFYIFLPALLIDKIASSSIKDMFDVKILIVLYGSVLLIFIVSILVSLSLKIDKKDVGTVAIGSFRGNFAYMGLPVAYYLFADEGIVISSMLIAFIVPFVNILSIFSLSLSSKGDYKKAIINSFLTPIVVASLLGIILSIYSVKIPNILEKFLNLLSAPALTLALLGIGASLQFKEIAKKPYLMILSSFFKLVMLPFFGIIFLHFIHINSVYASVVLIMLASPAATLNYIMAQQMDGDEILASATICFSTVFSFITYGFWIYYLKHCF